MPSPLAQAGATVEPSEYSALTQDEQFTGLWTQRSPLRDADVPYLYRKFYSASRFDSIIDGINREISARLTDVRRPGSSVYNDQAIPGINRFYPFKTYTNNQEIIRIIADCQGSPGTVRDVTGPHGNTIIRNKSAGAGKTSFLGVGNILYGSDGVDTWKLVTSSKSWTASTQYQTGDYIVDPNGNIQQSIGAQTANLANIEVDVYSHIVVSPPSHTYYYTVTLFFSPATPLNIKNNVGLTLSGLTTVPWMNGTTGFDPASETQAQTVIITLSGANPAVPFSTETGTATTGTGISGSTPPSWATNLGGVTQDGGNQWVNMGSAVQSWGGPGPASAPIVTQTPAPSLYPHWQANTWYAPSFQIVDSNSNLQQLVGPAAPTQIETGNAAPTWATTPGAITTESVGSGANAQWKCMGPAAWQAAHAYAVGDSAQATYSYWITTTQMQWQYVNGNFVQVPVQTQTSVTVTSLFQCITAGTSNNAPPAWVNGLNTVTAEAAPSTVVWKNVGNAPGWPGASQLLSLATRILDKNYNIETVTQMGESGAGPSEPTWNTAGKGSFTGDNTTAWRNDGPYSAAGTSTWQWAYSGKNSITGEVSNPSPLSLPFTTSQGQLPVIQGQGLPNPPWDQIILWRTAASGSTPFYEDEFPNPGAGAQWVYTDTHLDDTQLNTQIIAPGYGGSNPASGLTTPPPSTFQAPEYHCGRIFGIDGLYVRWSGGPDTLVGSGNSSFPPLNYFQLPEQPVKLKSVTTSGGGLIVFCVASTYIILGEGINATAVSAGSPFLPPKMFMEGVGLLSYDCLCMRGSTIYGFSNKSKCFSFDPANGEIEIGYPVGDQFKLVTTGGISAALYNPATAYVTWHEQDSTDTGLYVSDGAVGWFRWSPISPPESGSLWSPRAAIVGGTSAVQSVEVSPGLFKLLIGPSSSGPILYRDNTVSGDWTGSAYTGYPAWNAKGSIGLCETGEVAEIAHVALQSIALGARPVVSLLLDEIKAGVTVEGRTTAWDVLSLDDGRHEDPPNLEPSITIFSDRYKASSTAITPKCMNFQLRVDYGSQQMADELLKFGVYGAVFKERKQQ